LKVPKKLWWAGGLAALAVAAHIGTTPKRSDDLRVAVMSDCPLAKGALESGGGSELVAAITDAAASAAIKVAAQVVGAYGQAHVSPPRTGATAEHFYLLDPAGQLLVNRQIWACLVVSVKDLRGAPRAEGARDPYTADRVFLEARIVHAADGSAFELQPVTLRFREPAESSLLGSAARDLRFDIAFNVPGAKEPFARAAIDFAAMVPSADAQWGIDKLGSELAKRSGWLPAPPTANVPPKNEARRTRAHGPTTVQVSLVETREASVLWKFFGGLLDAVAAPGEAAAPKPAAPPAP
jgi:hypothetical protein